MTPSRLEGNIAQEVFAIDFIVAEFLALAPALHAERELVDRSIQVAVEATNASGAIGTLWGQESCEASCGTWPADARAWLSEATLHFKNGEASGPAFRLDGPAYHCMAAPFSSEGRALGLLALSGPSEFGSAQEQTILLLGRGTGISLENLARSNQALRRVEQVSLLYDVGKAMNSILDIRKLLDEIMYRGQEALMAEACSVLLVDEEKQELFFEIAKGQAGEALQQVRLKMDQGIAGWVATNAEPLIINDVSKDPRHFSKVDKDVKFVTRSILAVPMLARGKTIGVIEVINTRDGRDFGDEDLELLTALATDSAVSIDNARLFHAVMDGYLDTIKALAAAVDAKDPYTAGHIDRVSNYSIATGEVLQLSEEEMTALRYGSILHDVGKIGIADAILGKPAPLTREEFEIMSTHADIGSRMLEGIKFLEKARVIARHHHETWDGKGYPDGLKGEEIPRAARIVGAVDAFDAMTTDRPYRKALSVEFALTELRNKAGIQFDAEVVEAFAVVLKQAGRID